MISSVCTVNLTLLSYLLVISSLTLVVLNYKAPSLGKSLCSETFLWELNYFLFYSCHVPNGGVVFELQTGEVRHISHLNFIAWPDHDTPSQPDDLLTFISYMRHVHKSGPIITHCSAGIGRSGTLICIDVVLGLISRDLDVSIPKDGLSGASDLQEMCSTALF